MMGSEKSNSLLEKISSPATLKRYGFPLIAAVMVLALYLLTKGSDGGEDYHLAKMYETKYMELQILLDEKDKALNETYKALQKTYSANKMQEDTVKDMQLRLKTSQADLLSRGGMDDSIHNLEVKHASTEEGKKQAEVSVQMCRQEAASALQEKENLLWQHQQALERAREDEEALQRSVKEKEGSMHEKELELITHSKGCHSQLQQTTAQLEERERSLHWLVEKKRTEADLHGKRIEDAKSERSCQHDIDILKEELRKALVKQREMGVVDDLKASARWHPTMQMPNGDNDVIAKPSVNHAKSRGGKPEKQNAWEAAQPRGN